MDKIEIRKVLHKDCELLHRLAVDTFVESYGSVNTEANMQGYLNRNYSVEQLKLELKHPFSEFYFAYLNQEAVGFLKINFNEAQTKSQDKPSIEIERIYILKEFQGKQIGQLLFNKAIEIGKEHHAKYLWLGVWEKNEGAKRFYLKNGLLPYGKHIFKLGDEEQLDILMKVDL